MYVVTKYAGDTKSVKDSFNASLEKLGFDYVDLFLIHFHHTAENDQELQRQWAEMEEIKASGRAKSIGVSNFLVEHLEAILKTAKVKPAINSVEYHPYLQTAGLMDYHKKHGIAMSWYGALTPLTKAPDSAVAKLWKELASKYGVSEAEIGLRWCLDQGCVAITTSSNPDRIKLYGGRLHSFSLTEKDISHIADAGKNNHLRAYLKPRFAPWDAGVTKPAP
jgi:diketogulonate reductase-like aldo/keto reductase